MYLEISAQQLPSLVRRQGVYVADSCIAEWLNQGKDEWTVSIYYVFHMNYVKNRKGIDINNGI